MSYLPVIMLIKCDVFHRYVVEVWCSLVYVLLTFLTLILLFVIIDLHELLFLSSK